MQNKKTLKITVTAVMVALGTVIYMIFPEVPLVPSVEYLKMDFSDIPALLSGILLGPLYGIAVEVLKNIIHLTKTTSFGIGELINVGLGSSLVLSLTGFMKLFSKVFKKDGFSFKVYIISALLTVAVATVSGWILNALLTPVYFLVMGFPITAKTVLAGVLGSTLLNVIKASLNVLPFYPVYSACYRAFYKICH
ncbi:MAG: ECF transporter S component [Clostridia bacterium]|nr:ECF transporter S component [Clostridia bacterium]